MSHIAPSESRVATACPLWRKAAAGLLICGGGAISGKGRHIESAAEQCRALPTSLRTVRSAIRDRTGMFTELPEESQSGASSCARRERLWRCVLDMTLQGFNDVTACRGRRVLPSRQTADRAQRGEDIASLRRRRVTLSAEARLRPRWHAPKRPRAVEAERVPSGRDWQVRCRLASPAPAMQRSAEIRVADEAL